MRAGASTRALLGRSEELRRFAHLLAAAQDGRSSAVLIRGEPGIGKSALLRELKEQATRADFVVCSTRGIESEPDVVYAGVAELISPLADRLDLVPPAQAVALRSALALGPPAEASAFAVATATLSLLAVVAPETRVVVAVDDAQWLDSASTRVLSFVARRVRAEGVVVVACVRSDERCTLDLSEAVSFSLTGLGGDAAAALLNGDPRRPVSRRVVDDLVAATNGNPLALQEVAAALPPP